MRDMVYVTAVALGIVFLVSGLQKLRDPFAFVLAVLEYDVLDPKVARLYARAVPPLEVTVGVGLLAGIFPLGAAILALVLILSFLFGVCINLVRGRELDCHCFGSSSGDKLGKVSVFRLLVLLGFAIITISSGTFQLSRAFPSQALPLIAIAISLDLFLYLSRSFPAAAEPWTSSARPGKKPTGGRISLRAEGEPRSAHASEFVSLEW